MSRRRTLCFLLSNLSLLFLLLLLLLLLSLLLLFSQIRQTKADFLAVTNEVDLPFR
jgi:hypothetical protein